ncbi:hypothetical protein [Nitrosomonas sp. sh817]|uniref:hypothetical protein n=1 Tax=Nitrosomonas sp. sh817 TaxID=3070658 RepID=UPI0027DAF513|nr:hypothetical protein [Nitrosomonas sp. sh817]WMJ09667.1 hypothetical protein RBH92_05595 [Nitrosomonas sp. sh817]
MSESNVVSSLVAKRAEMSGLIQQYQSEIDRILGEISHLDATIKLFAPELDLRSIRAKKRRVQNKYFKPGECPRLVLDILRKAGCSITSRRIAEAMLQAKGLETTPEMIDQMQRNALGVLKILEKKELVIQGSQDGIARTWKVI